MTSRVHALARALLLVGMLVGLAAPLAQAQADPRFFPQTNFRIDNDQFYNYFLTRGGINTFGYPVSRTFTLLGSTVQIFQRRVLQLQGGGTVGQLNLLDSPFLPYTSFNFSVVPAADPAIVAAAPVVGSPNYATAVQTFVQQHAPNTFNGLPVNFYTTYANTVSLATAFPNGGGNASLLPGFDLEMWGVPVSNPAPDPHNGNFIYLRFQRGIMQYNNTNHTTQGLLLGDYFKSILTGTNLPADLAAEAAGSEFFNQYNNSLPNGLNRPAALPNSNLTNAFVTEAPVANVSSGLQYGFNVWMFGQNQQQILGATTGAGFGWIKQQIRWSDLEPTRGNIQFSQMDPIVNNAQAAGVNVLFSVVTAPTWTRSEPGVDGPPDNFNDLGDFVAALAQRYGTRVAAYEIWNEENFATEWMGRPLSAATYIQMLEVAYNRIKAVNPSILVVSGALTPTGVNDGVIAIDDTVYLTEMYQFQNGVFKNFADEVGAHMAGYNNPPQDFVGQNSFFSPCFTNTGQNTGTTNCFKNNGQFYFRRIDQLNGIMSSVGDSRKMWITEYEWGSATPPVPAGYEWTLDLTEDQVGNFFVQSVQMIQQSRPWVGAVFIWNLNWRIFSDPHTNEAAIFGILNPDGSPRSIYTKLAQLPK